MDIRRVAKKTGVTSRTLRHYDDIGLLKPAEVGHDGRRWYGDEELLRLQHILVLRELGVDLATAARVLVRARRPRRWNCYRSPSVLRPDRSKPLQRESHR